MSAIEKATSTAKYSRIRSFIIVDRIKNVTSRFEGETVQLDFWATWCPPCQADAPAIDKLNAKFGDKDLKVIGISTDEDRETGEKYLKKHPHNFPVVLSSDNLMPVHIRSTYFPLAL